MLSVLLRLPWQLHSKLKCWLQFHDGNVDGDGAVQFHWLPAAITQLSPLGLMVTWPGAGGFAGVGSDVGACAVVDVEGGVDAGPGAAGEPGAVTGAVARPGLGETADSVGPRTVGPGVPLCATVAPPPHPHRNTVARTMTARRRDETAPLTRFGRAAGTSPGVARRRCGRPRPESVRHGSRAARTTGPVGRRAGRPAALRGWRACCAGW